MPVRNALSADIGSLRRSLLPTLLDSARNNATRGTQDLALFEIGRVWQSDSEGLNLLRPRETRLNLSHRDKRPSHQP